MLTNPYSLPTIITGHRNIGSPYMLAVQGRTESSPVHPITLSIPTTAVRMLVRWYVRLPVPLVQQSVSQFCSIRQSVHQLVKLSIYLATIVHPYKSFRPLHVNVSVHSSTCPVRQPAHQTSRSSVSQYVHPSIHRSPPLVFQFACQPLGLSC